jgi:hypothetical protein
MKTFRKAVRKVSVYLNCQSWNTEQSFASEGYHRDCSYRLRAYCGDYELL